MDEDLLLNYEEFAQLAGVAYSTMRAYRSQGRLPEPDLVLYLRGTKARAGQLAEATIPGSGHQAFPETLRSRTQFAMKPILENEVTQCV